MDDPQTPPDDDQPHIEHRSTTDERSDREEATVEAAELDAAAEAEEPDGARGLD